MLELAPELSLPNEAALQRFAILAMTGAGKSNTAAVMAEEMYDAGIPWVAIDPKGDWWGMRSSKSGKGDGLKVPVLGGLNGDVPRQPTAGKLIAETIAAERLTCILDVSEFDTKADQLRFLTDFANTLLKKNRDPLMVFAEEADEYLPEGVRAPEAQCVGAWSRLVKRGRFRGIFVTLITQRSASLNKNALNQVDTLIPMRTAAPHDIKAIKLWVQQHAVGAEMLESLPSLDDGEAWIWSPHKLKMMERVPFRRRRTYDSGETPTLGSERISAKLANVDLTRLSERMAETIEEAEKNDPEKLRSRIRELETTVSRLETQKPEPSPPPEPEIVEVAVFPQPLKQAIHNMLTGLAMSTLDRASAFSKEVEEMLDNLDLNFELGLEIQEERAQSIQPVNTPTPVAAAAPSPTKTPRDLDRAPQVQPELDGVSLKKGELKMLTTLVQHHPMRMTRVQLGTLAGFTARGGTFRNYFGTLKRNGLIVEEGKEVTASQTGFDLLGENVPPPPTTPQERTDVWRKVLKAGEREMLDFLLAAQGVWVSREALGDSTGFTHTGGTFRNYLGTLARNGLVEKDGDMVRAAEFLF